MPPPRKRKAKALRPLYRDLDPADLFDLVVAAVARGDPKEAAAALREGQTVWVAQLPPAFQRRYHAARALMDVFVRDAAHLLGCLYGLEMAEELEPLAERLSGDPSFRPGDPLVREMVARGVRVALASLLSAFEEVCTAHGLSPALVLVAFAPEVAGEIEDRRAELASVSARPEVAARDARRLEAAWAELGGRS